MVFWVGRKEKCIKVAHPLILEKYDITFVSLTPSFLSYLFKELKSLETENEQEMWKVN